MKTRLLAALLLLGILSGCIDDRIKRQGSLLNVKTQVTANEFNAAATPAEKLKIAGTYFESAPKMTQIMDDYLQGRKPVNSAPVVTPTPP